MRARIIITDQKGDRFEGTVKLSRASTTRQIVGPERRAPKLPADRELEFDMPVRAFVKAHVRGLSGPKKFVLLTAYLTKGKEGNEVTLQSIERHWNRMTAPALMGGEFNRKYSAMAREDGWVDTKRPGIYVLRPSWRKAFS